MLSFMIVDFLIAFRKGLWIVKDAANKSGFRKGKCFDYINFAINGDVSLCPNVKYFLQRTEFVRKIFFRCKLVNIRKIHS